MNAICLRKTKDTFYIGRQRNPTSGNRIWLREDGRKCSFVMETLDFLLFLNEMVGLISSPLSIYYFLFLIF